MIDNLSINALIKPTGATDVLEIQRLLWFSVEQDVAYLIPIEGKKGLPFFINLSVVTEKLARRELEIVSDDPWARAFEESELTEAALNVRNMAWKVIESLVQPEMEPEIYQKRIRGSLVIEAARSNQLTATAVYKYLRKFWQRGKTKNALLPDFDKRGGKGKEKSISEKKRGRPGKDAAISPSTTTVNVDETIKRNIRNALSRYYLTKKETPMKKAYDLMIRDFFQEDFYFKDGIQQSILVPPVQRPSFAQFKYWANKFLNPEKIVTARKGKVVFSKNVRPHLGNSTSEAFSPGQKCQIDATVADVYLRSRYNRQWIIGRPVIYVVIDIFSRMIVGIYVGLEGPSWLGAMMALANTSVNKLSYCKDYGITLEEGEWPCEGLPSVFLSDGGELKSKKADSLTANLNIGFETAKAYAPDWKGIVESQFRTLHLQVKPFVPGYVEKDADKRIGRDYRLDAKLDIFQFTNIILHCVRQHNKQYLENYPRNEQMIEAGVEPIPIKLWEWGVINRGSGLRKYNENIVKLNIMPTAEATITKSGIHFEKMRYSCEQAIKEQWFEMASLKGSRKIMVCYDPRTTNYLYIKSPDGKSYEKCYLLNAEERFLNKDIYDVRYFYQNESQQKRQHTGQQQQVNVNLAEVIEHIVKEAETLTDAVPAIQSNREAVSYIRQNRAIEKQKLREKEAFNLLSSNDEGDLIKGVGKIIPMPLDSSTPERRAYPSNIELLRKKRTQIKGESGDDRS